VDLRVDDETYAAIRVIAEQGNRRVSDVDVEFRQQRPLTARTF
jgi:hypothetical protein